MTATSTAPVTVSRSEALSAPSRGGFGRWLRSAYKVVIPLAVGLLLIVGTFVAHSLQSVDESDPNYLNPRSSAAIGGSRLAADLAAKGIQVQRATSTADALQLLFHNTATATLFIPALAYVSPSLRKLDSRVPSGTRIVVIAPDDDALSSTGWPIHELGSRWAPVTADPFCGLPEARAAGVTGVDGLEYSIPTQDAVSCYNGALVSLDEDGEDRIVAGASDPFRNDRIGEYGNETLAVGLLSAEPRVVWLDIHTAEPPIKASPVGGVPPTASSGGGGGTGGPLPSGNPSADSGSRASPLQKIIPSWVWAGIGLIILAGLVVAVAAARRMGTPVPEPLPVAARLNETVEGRGRLYRRSGDRTAALHILQNAAIERVRAANGLPTDATEEHIVDATVAYLGVSTEEVAKILYGDVDGDDDDLLYAVACLDVIVESTDPAAAYD